MMVANGCLGSNCATGGVGVLFDKKPDLLVANYCATECSFPPVEGSVGVLLGNGNGTFKAVKTYPSGGDGAVSVAVADLNQDGKPDLLVANCGPLACGPGSPGGNVGVLIGNGNGTFKPVVNYPAANSPFNVVAADVNNDGQLDIVVSNWGTPNAATNDGGHRSAGQGQRHVPTGINLSIRRSRGTVGRGCGCEQRWSSGYSAGVRRGRSEPKFDGRGHCAD
jgi:hypothetical protein